MWDGSQYPAPVCGAVTGANQSTVVPRPGRQRLLRAALLPPGAVPDVLVPGAAGVGRHVVGPGARRALRLRDGEARRPLVAAAVVPGLPREALAGVGEPVGDRRQVTVARCEAEARGDRARVALRDVVQVRRELEGVALDAQPALARGRDQARSLVGGHGDHGQVHAAHPLDQRAGCVGDDHQQRCAVLGGDRRAGQRVDRVAARHEHRLPGDVDSRVLLGGAGADEHPGQPYPSVQRVPTRLVDRRDHGAARGRGDQVEQRLEPCASGRRSRTDRRRPGPSAPRTSSRRPPVPGRPR